MDTWKQTAAEILAEIKRIDDENAKLRDALHEYANPDNWRDILANRDARPYEVWVGNGSGASIAEAALAEQRIKREAAK